MNDDQKQIYFDILINNKIKYYQENIFLVFIKNIAFELVSI